MAQPATAVVQPCLPIDLVTSANWHRLLGAAFESDCIAIVV